ncbi:probable alpha,alpha-trehalose-phosphate synthase [UDP-forming] 10 [Solanum tuberosum]|uniref:probable alpha,alpha-trehalose-phosphate synthase [UDP-forming] 10 n=1 Tax=Solanum tuberosum TaxID=4113 RepID=UPI00073A19BF|nr:PREDICTED: probable alpha,alpha-trehalose-phosphate synthase [UDP-forming] 10 [Solanum tuberosum]
MVKAPSAKVISLLNALSNEPKNTVSIVSGRGRTSLCEWLAPCERLGIAAEHGYFIRDCITSEWDHLDSDLEWKEIAEPVMQLYTEATDGSFIESKESAMVWHHYDADILMQILLNN